MQIFDKIGSLLCAAVVLIVSTGLLPTPARAEDAAAPPAIPAKIDLQDGDTLVFLGDSITHQLLYTQYVEDFLYTRFPDRRINFHNAGIGGAQAWDALQRIHRDVLDYKPRYVTILLGMNDGRYQPFNPEIFQTYHDDMTQLIMEIRDGGAIPILMSPTMFDARASSKGNRPRGAAMLEQYNSVLAYYGRWLQDQAIEGGMSYVDMFSMLNDLTLEQRETDAAFTMIRDGVHPDPPGQLVMAFAMIEDLGLRSQLSNIRIVPKTGGDGLNATAKGGSISNLKRTNDGLEFDWTADSLPWVVPPEAQSGADMLKLGTRASREALEIHGLDRGKYELSIDGTVVGAWRNIALEHHIELQQNDRTPQYQQAMQVVMRNRDRNTGPLKRLRDTWGTFQGWARMQRQLAANPDNADVVRDLTPKIEAAGKRLESLEATIKETEAEARKIENEIYELNQPKTRHYIVKRTQP
ncbi:MAG: SGNH/GDSL hydrolase family protein [Planctomycetaceae bacterium]